jgi:PKD repeat protein
VNAPPVAAFEWSPSVPSVGEPVTFNAVRDRSLSYDPDGTLVSYAWDFGDNTPAVTIRPPQTQVAHAFTRSGIYRVTLTVTDSDGASMSYSKDVRVNQPPVASFIWSPEKVNSGEEITFDASGSYDPDGQILSYSWDFGDGRTSTGMQVSQRYTTGGDYTVRLVVRDNDGAMGTLTRTVHVNLPPSARFSWLSRVPQIGEVVQFDGSSSSDPDGQVVSYSWDFGDGSPVEFGVRVSHAYSAPGTYTVVLTVSDDRGLTGVSRQAVRVNAPPVAAFEWSPTIPSAGVSVTFTAVRDRTLSYDPDGTIVSYTWDFGDRTPPVTIKAPATSVAHAYAQCGSYTVTLTVTDSDGAMATASRDLGVNCSPVAAFDWSPKEPDRGEAVTFDASSSYDRDGTIASYSWDFGDGTPSVTIRDPQVTHEFSRYGTYTVRLTVRDDHGAPGIVSAIVKIVDRIPPTSVASVPSLVCPHGWYDRPVTIMLIASDNDAVATIQYRVNSGSIRSVSGTSAGVLIERDGIYTVEYWATDRSGNEESPHNTIVVSVDQVPPTITIRVPSAGAAFYLNQPVTPEVTVADALSGVAEEVVDPAIDTSSVGRRTFTAKATDRACLTSSVTRTYFVRYKTLLVSPAEQEFGWAAPPPPEGLRGQPIPVSFRVTLGAPLPVALVFLDFYATRVRPGVLPALQVISVRGSGAGETYTPVAGLGGTLIYNDVTSRYEITIPTYTLARGIYELWISADDGGIHRIRFQVV